MWQSYLHKEHVAKKLAAYKKVAIPFKQGVFQFSIYNFKKILSPLRGRELERGGIFNYQFSIINYQLSISNY